MKKTTHIVINGRIRTVESPDWAGGHRSADMILRLRGAYLAQELDIAATAMTHEERPREILAQDNIQK